MDWDLKVPSWDIAEFEPSIGSMDNDLGQQNRLGCSVDLKLGRLGELESFEKLKEQLTVPASMLSPSGSLKRTRAQIHGSQSVFCLVDGCRSDLSKCREYHRRHMVCEAHSKTPTVSVGGQEQRFCQQCSKFHLLMEFDEVKRSCRKRLEGHNRRRRKPQQELMNTRKMILNLQVPGFSSNARVFSTAIPHPNWIVSSRNEEGAPYRHHHQPFHIIGRQQHMPVSYIGSHKDGKQFSQDTNNAAISKITYEPSATQPPRNTSSSSESSNRKMFDSTLTHALNSDRALSLLSSPIHTPSIIRGNTFPSEHSNLSRYSHSHAPDSSVSAARFCCSGTDTGRASAVLVSDASNADLHFHGIYHSGSDGSNYVPSHALPFCWQ